MPYPVLRLCSGTFAKPTASPTASTDTNSVMVSGGSDALLNDLCENGLESFSEINPWNSFVEIISKQRYASLDSVFAEFTG